MLVGEKAKARLVYEDGCSIQLKPQSLTTVSVASTCAVITPAADMPVVVEEARPFPWPILLAVPFACIPLGCFEDDDNDDNDDGGDSPD